MFVQKIKKSIFNLLVLAQLVAPLPAYAGGDPNYKKPLTRDEVLAASGDLLIDTLNKNGDSINIKWIQGQFKAQSEGGTLFDIKAFSVIKEYENQVFFTQYGFSNNENTNAANVGLGFYHLISPSIMIGGNVFYDAQTANSSPENTSRSLSDSIHQRYSVGGTIMTSQAGAFFNIYRGISKGMTDYTVADGLGQYEVSDGYDFGVNGLVPGLESINLGITQYKFNEENQGSKFKVEYKPNSVFTFGVEQDQSDTPSSSLYIATKYAFDTSLEEQLKPAVQAYSSVWSKRYDEVERNNKITLEYTKQGVVVATVPAAVWGDSVQIPTPTGGGTGKITYMIKESVQQNAYGEGEEEEKENIEVSGTGLVTGVKTPQTVVVEVSRAADTSYSASSVDVSIKFGKRDAELNIDENENEGDEAVIPAKEWGQNIDIPEPNIGIPDPTGNGTSKFEYTLTDRGNTDVELEVNESGVGAVLKNAKGPGKVLVTVTRLGDDLYDESTLNISTEFTPKDEEMSLSEEATAEWGTGVALKSFITGGGTGKIELTLEEENGTSATVDELGDNIIGAKQSGTVTVKAVRETDGKFLTSEKEFQVVFTKQDIELEIADIASKKLGEAISLVDKVSIKDKDPKDPSRFRYELIADENLAEAELIEGVVSNAQRGGTVGVRVIRDTDDQYLETFKDVTVTFDLLVEDITVNNLPSELQWGSDFNLKKYITSGGEGVISYSVASDSEVNPTLDADNGAITDMTEPGTVIVKVSRVKSLTHAAHEITVPVTFGLQIPRLAKTMDITGVKHGSTANIKNNINLTNLASENLPKAALLYLSSDTAIATVSREGIVSLTSGASLPNLVVITVTSPKDDKYDLVSESITVNFVKAGGDVTVDPIDSTPWSESGINISEKVKGTGNGVFKYTIEAGDGNNTAGAVFDGGVLKATQRGIVRFKVTQEEGVNNTEATSDLVTVQFQKQDIELEIADIASKKLGEAISLVDKVSIKDKDPKDPSRFRYELIADENLAEAELIEGVVSNAQRGGTVGVRVIRDTDDQYLETFKDVTVTFDLLVEDITVNNLPSELQWGSDFNLKKYITSGGEGTISYSVASDSEVNPSLDPDNGAITDMTEPGTVIVKVSRVKSLTHAAHEITVPVTFGLQIPRLAKTMDITGVKYGSTANIKNNINLTNLASENLPKAALLYLSSDTAIATVSREGIVSLTSGASLPNLVVITVTSPKDDKYDLVSESITVNFVKAGGDVTVDPIDSTPWSESGINISEKVKGTGNGVFKYTIEAGDGNNTAGAVFDGGVLKATQRGIVRFKVTQEEGVNNTEATSDLVTVQFQKQEAIIEEITDSGRPDTISLALDSVDISSYFQAKAKSDSNVVLTGLTYHKGDSADGTYSVGTDGVVTSSIAQTVNVIVRRADSEKYTADDLDITVEFVQAVGSISVDTIDPIDWNALTGININSKLDRNGDGEVTYDIVNNTANASFSGYTLTALQSGEVTFRATQKGTDRFAEATSELTTVVFTKQWVYIVTAPDLPTTVSLGNDGRDIDLAPYFKTYSTHNPNVTLGGMRFSVPNDPYKSYSITPAGVLSTFRKQRIEFTVDFDESEKYRSTREFKYITYVD